MSLDKNVHLKRVLELNKTLKSSEKVSRKICEELGIEHTSTISRKVRLWIQKAGKSNPSPKTPTGEVFKKAQSKKVDKTSKYFLITSAQNATPVNKELLVNMEAYAKYLGGSIEVLGIRYRNPTSVFTDKKEDWWAPELEQYLIANRHNLNKHLTVLGDVKTQPTASMPLSGMEGLTGVESSIIPHPRQHLVSLPVLEGYPKKVMLSTGSLTVPNFTDSKIGKTSAFHFVYGFVIVEIKDEEVFYIRHVSAQKNGTFYDLDYKVEAGKVYESQDNVEAVVLGDLHLGEHCDKSLKCSYEMLGRFNPKNVILHDLIDSHSVSHHEKKDPFLRMQRELEGGDIVDKEIQMSLDFLQSIIKYRPTVVYGNHDDFLQRWLRDVDWRKESNKYTYLKYAKLMADGKMPKGILAYEAEKKFGDKVICLDEQSSFRVRGVELGQHGHLGANGSRGSASQFKRLNTKMVTGHSHTPSKIDGHSSVGCLTKLRLNYTKGLSSWMNSNVIIHKNGKTQNLLIIDGQFTTI